MMQPEGAAANAAACDPWIEQARFGSREAVDQLLHVCRDYLLLIANRELDSALRAKVSPSDLVQETLLVGYERFGDFQGKTQDELFKWLRRILINQCHDAERKHLGAQKRTVEKEVPLEVNGTKSGLNGYFLDESESPSNKAVGREESERIEQVIASLPEDYQQVIRLRGWEDQSFEEIGPTMGRSPDAARKLWFRAMQQLGQILRTHHDGVGSQSNSP
jgi:RNA polymerase sigma-70 factor (ECF subfamily)